MDIVGVKTIKYNSISELLQSYDKKARIIIYFDGSSAIEVNNETDDNNVSDWQVDRHFQNIEELQNAFTKRVLIYN